MLIPIPDGSLPWPHWDAWMAYQQFYMTSSTTCHHNKGRHSPFSSLSRRLDPQEKTFEEQKVRVDKRGHPSIPQTNISSSSPDETVIASPPSLADDFKQLQDLIKMIIDFLQIPFEEVKESQLTAMYAKC